MSEKVYGICGTNKCRKEVIAKDEFNSMMAQMLLSHFVVVQKTLTLGEADSELISYPSGFNYGSCFAISFAADGIVGHPDYYCNLKQNGIVIGSFGDVSPQSVTFTILLYNGAYLA